MIPAVSIEELKTAWPLFVRETTRERRRDPKLPLALRVRCAILKRFLKIGCEPTELMFSVMAEMPLDEFFKSEAQRQIE